MKLSYKIIYYLSCITLFLGCSDEISENTFTTTNSKDQTVEAIQINTFRQIGNDTNDRSFGISTRSSGANEFEDIREVESNETVVVPSLASHIWLGNIIGKQSAVNADYLPLAYRINPIKVTSSLPPNYPSGAVELPSYQSMYRFVSEKVLPNSSFEQNEEFKFSISQFTSYNELKEVFGNNINTSALFWGSSSGESNSDHTISTATGFYVKFYQTSYTVTMDYPQNPIASDLSAQSIDSAVYVNSIAFGRLGVLTVETNTLAEETKRKLNSTFNTIFTSGQSYLTQEEKNFLNGCDFKLFLISGNGKTSVESFHGYAGFIDHISKGKFSRRQPGSPIFCTFAYVKNNAPFKAVFK